MCRFACIIKRFAVRMVNGDISLYTKIYSFITHTYVVYHRSPSLVPTGFPVPAGITLVRSILLQPKEKVVGSVCLVTMCMCVCVHVVPVTVSPICQYALRKSLIIPSLCISYSKRVYEGEGVINLEVLGQETCNPRSGIMLLILFLEEADIQCWISRWFIARTAFNQTWLMSQQQPYLENSNLTSGIQALVLPGWTAIMFFMWVCL